MDCSLREPLAGCGHDSEGKSFASAGRHACLPEAGAIIKRGSEKQLSELLTLLIEASEVVDDKRAIRKAQQRRLRRFSMRPRSCSFSSNRRSVRTKWASRRSAYTFVVALKRR